ncbi:MAG TPA: VWA domain-containing protein [Bacteroidota bacterium]|nr:VWA domain-containing protein [Bacteroidota bacterium]
MLRFAHPEFLWYLLAVPVLGVAFVFLNRWKHRLLARFAGSVLAKDLTREWSGAKNGMKQTLILLSLSCLILAVANPQEGTRLEEIKRQGIDLFVALDVSLSMKAEDIKPSRLEKAKRDVSSLLSKLAGDRVGLVVFAGDAFVQFPLTSDYSAADLFISTVDVDAVPIPGTMIGSAIDLALKSFSKDLPTQKAIIVVSDGENTEGDVQSAVDDAKNAGVRVYTIGMGTPDGGPIPIYNDAGERVDFKHDRAGSIVVTKLDESALQQIASSTGGSYRRATSGGNEIDDVFKELESLQKTEFSSKQVSGYESRYQYPLVAAILFLMAESLIGERKGKIVAALKRFVPIFGSVAALLLALTVTADGQTVHSLIKEGNRVYGKGRYDDAEVEYKKALEQNQKSPQAVFDLGNAQYKQQRFDEAIRQFQTSAAEGTSKEEKSAALYNIGNSLYRAGKYPDCIQAYKQALRLNPDDEDARYNLEMAREKMKQQQQQKQQNKQNQQNQQQNQQQQQQNQPQNRPQNKEQQRQEEIQRKNQMPKQEAERILEALRNNEKQVQKKLQKREPVKVRVEKDW